MWRSCPHQHQQQNASAQDISRKCFSSDPCEVIRVWGGQTKIYYHRLNYFNYPTLPIQFRWALLTNVNSIGIKLRWHTDSGLVVYKRKKAQVWMSFWNPTRYSVSTLHFCLLLMALKTQFFPYQALYQWTYVPILTDSVTVNSVNSLVHDSLGKGHQMRMRQSRRSRSTRIY